MTILNYILFRIYLRKYKRKLSIGQMEELSEIKANLNSFETTKGLIYELL